MDDLTRDEIQKAADVLVCHGIPWDESVMLMKRAIIDRALEATNGNQCRAAKLLKVHRNTIHRIMRETA